MMIDLLDMNNVKTAFSKATNSIETKMLIKVMENKKQSDKQIYLRKKWKSVDIIETYLRCLQLKVTVSQNHLR